MFKMKKFWWFFSTNMPKVEPVFCDWHMTVNTIRCRSKFPSGIFKLTHFLWYRFLPDNVNKVNVTKMMEITVILNGLHRFLTKKWKDQTRLIVYSKEGRKAKTRNDLCHKTVMIMINCDHYCNLGQDNCWNYTQSYLTPDNPFFYKRLINIPFSCFMSTITHHDVDL